MDWIHGKGEPFELDQLLEVNPPIQEETPEDKSDYDKWREEKAKRVQLEAEVAELKVLLGNE